MCGIAVAVNWENAENAVKSMLGGIMHRGDVTDPIVSLNSRTAMGTRRLRIVDADHAVQPQISFDGKILVSFNGEIYNHKDLRHELEDMGIKFKTHCDTEVIASALQVWGPTALQKFIGMFAFVAIDISTGNFVAARDPLGVKPLYYIEANGGFLFCSEIRPLLNATETGEVIALTPGFIVSKEVRGAYQSRLGIIPPPPPQGDKHQLDALLREAVRIRLPSDLPVVSMFSGGIDSTLTTHYAREFDDKIPGYFLGGPGAPDYEFAARYAEMTDLDFRLVPFSFENKDAFAPMADIVATCEAFEPEVVRGAICSYVLARQVHADGFRVALCGEGADELFCGYLPLELVFAESGALGSPVRGQCLSHMHRTNLQRVDRCSMHFQLETRVPFLDPTIIVYALGLDASALVQEFDDVPRGKMPLRELYDLYPNQLPTEIRDRTKVPFNVGAGFDKSDRESPWFHMAEESISDKHFKKGMKRYQAFSIKTKEELMYIELLAETMDIFRVNHLKARTYLIYPDIKRLEQLRGSIVGNLNRSS